MKSQVLYQHDDLAWVVMGRDPDKPNDVIDTNEYLIVHKGEGLLMDPGGTEIFPEVVNAVSEHVAVDKITNIFGSHQDPDILSSLALWLRVCPNARIHVPWVWAGFITHFGCDQSMIDSVPDEGGEIDLVGHKVQMIPAHYLHSSGNLHIYDPTTRIYFSGDVGAALLPDDQTQMFVTDFDAHCAYMEGFHKRWMPSNKARDEWVERVRGLEIDMHCPQHGAIFRGPDVERFLDWFSGLELGSASNQARAAALA